MACTLSAENFKKRVKWLNDLTSEALLSHHIERLSAHLTYMADAAEDIEKLVPQEQCCCTFLRFDVTRATDYVELTMTAPAAAGDDARALFAHLVPS